MTHLAVGSTRFLMASVMDLDPDGRDVFAHFGFAVAKAQAVERLLAAFVVYPRLVELQTQGERNTAVAEIHGLSLEQLCKRVQKMGFTPLADAVETAVASVRNMTVHRYFWERGRFARLQTVAGRAELCAELTAIATRCDDVETVLRKLVPFDAQMWKQTRVTVIASVEHG